MKSATTVETATFRFSANLGEDGLVALPKDAPEVLTGTMVEGTVQGFPFRARVEGNRIELSKSQQSAAGLKGGDTAAIEITRIGNEAEVRVPADFDRALKESRAAGELFAKITPNTRREWVRWIASAKQEETRERRIEVGIDKLCKGMRRPCCFPGLNWVTKDLVTPGETWAPLSHEKK